MLTKCSSLLINKVQCILKISKQITPMKLLCRLQPHILETSKTAYLWRENFKRLFSLIKVGVCTCKLCA